ncbi:diguanylate cyclase [Halomonas sp. Y3S6]|uniref:Diguanylate cyclase n=2 Tax=Billgrantia antri TaxID=2846777 RepID=A0ABS6ZIZ0_9GAMM|nr:diguanylate cyclase [Halomonas antri]MBW6390028.1 diguanylate cyclase [Halomonas antri]
MTWLVIVGLLLFVAWISGQKLMHEANLSHLGYQAEILSRELRDRLNLRFTALEMLSSQLTNVSGEDVSLLLQKNPSLLAYFEGIVISNADGELIADLPEVPGRVGFDISDTEYFGMVSSTPWPYVSRPFFGRTSYQPLVMLLVPRLTAQGEFGGVIGGLLNFAHGQFFSSISSLTFEHSGHVAIFTSAGEPLFVPGSISRLVGSLQHLDPPAFQLALDGWQGETSHKLDGEDVLVGYRQVWEADWVVAMIMPRESMLAPFESFLERLWWTWLVVVLVLLFVIRWLVGHQLKPLHRLERQIGEIGSGARHQLALSTGLRELAQISEAFNGLEKERKNALQHSKQREAFLDAVLGSTPVGMFVADQKGDLIYLNPALTAMLRLLPDASTHDLWQRIHVDDRKDAHDMWLHAMNQGREFLRQLRMRDDRGTLLWVEIHASRVQGDGGSLGVVGTIKDITERQHQEALQRWEAEHDPLTGLLNRRGFHRRLEDAMADFSKLGTPAAVILFDLDHFKPVNDEGGHALGDELLRRVAQVLVWEVRRSDHIARQGGDEFGLLLPSCTLSQAVTIAESLCVAISQVSVSHEGKEYFVTASMGLTALREGDESLDSILARADAASYDAKKQGRNKVVVDGSDASHARRSSSTGNSPGGSTDRDGER